MKRRREVILLEPSGPSTALPAGQDSLLLFVKLEVSSLGVKVDSELKLAKQMNNVVMSSVNLQVGLLQRIVFWG